jgi:hypothetical protein
MHAHDPRIREGSVTSLFHGVRGFVFEQLAVFLDSLFEKLGSECDVQLKYSWVSL